MKPAPTTPQRDTLSLHTHSMMCPLILVVANLPFFLPFLVRIGQTNVTKNETTTKKSRGAMTRIRVTWPDRSRSFATPFDASCLKKGLTGPKPDLPDLTCTKSNPAALPIPTHPSTRPHYFILAQCRREMGKNSALPVCARAAKGHIIKSSTMVERFFKGNHHSPPHPPSITHTHT